MVPLTNPPYPGRGEIELLFPPHAPAIKKRIADTVDGTTNQYTPGTVYDRDQLEISSRRLPDSIPCSTGADVDVVATKGELRCCCVSGFSVSIDAVAFELYSASASTKSCPDD